MRSLASGSFLYKSLCNIDSFQFHIADESRRIDSNFATEERDASDEVSIIQREGSDCMSLGIKLYVTQYDIVSTFYPFFVLQDSCYMEMIVFQ